MTDNDRIGDRICELSTRLDHLKSECQRFNRQGKSHGVRYNGEQYTIVEMIIAFLEKQNGLIVVLEEEIRKLREGEGSQ